VVFVTAYDEYAIKAFKLNAVDYILKPISITELKEAVYKLRERLRYKQILSEGSIPYIEIANQVTNRLKSQKISLKDNNAIEVVDFKDIYFVEAQGSYVRIMFLKGNDIKEITLSGSLTDYEELMPDEFFYRIHKSYLINCMHVQKILKDEYSQVVMKDNFTLPISRRRFAPLMHFLKSNDYYHE
jgi:two-component system LytT family response regulator